MAFSADEAAAIDAYLSGGGKVTKVISTASPTFSMVPRRGGRGPSAFVRNRSIAADLVSRPDHDVQPAE